MNILATKTSRSFSPLDVGIIHFIGIGGIGMSGIAEVLHNLGYQVQGSDLGDNANTRRLRTQGISILIGHEPENVQNVGVVVLSSAIHKDNPELLAAREAFIPVVRRAEMLGELMRLKWSVAVAGTHGKTTTTTMVSTLFEEAQLDPTVINGGIINAYGANNKLGSGDWMIVESDESDGSFTRLPATIAIVTNIDPEHMDHYGDFAAVRRAYDTFVQNIPFYGFAVLCVDHPEVQAMIARIIDRKIVTYGLSSLADVRAINLRPTPNGTTFDLTFANRDGNAEQTTWEDLHLPIIGQHNVLNALAVITVGLNLHFSEQTIRQSLLKFSGVKRRFTKTGVVNGITIIDDYGHHPTEIATTLKAALQAKGEEGHIIAVIQPHRYSRLSSLFNEFCTCCNDANKVIVADVYPAGEAPIEGATMEALVSGLRAHGHKDVHSLKNPEALAQMIAESAKPGDFVICLGAGSISTWAQVLPAELEALLTASNA